ncbi:MAG: hypothetical protein KC776_07510 [Myxococcales bacterium]|nr:hypothetical protein [Myxococcales bacterium]MCB9583104.1 hypothetical protein [Polyangiaceae bacterium]
MTQLALLVLAAGLAVACSSSEAGESAGKDSGLPTSFGDCSSPPCQVALEAFTSGTKPYCSTDKPTVECSSTNDVRTATCGDVFVVRTVYGFPGDFYECLYDTTSNALVGAKWSPDNHPTQIAGKQLPDGCTPTPVCAVSLDAGSD